MKVIVLIGINVHFYFFFEKDNFTFIHIYKFFNMRLEPTTYKCQCILFFLHEITKENLTYLNVFTKNLGAYKIFIFNNMRNVQNKVIHIFKHPYILK